MPINVIKNIVNAASHGVKEGFSNYGLKKAQHSALFARHICPLGEVIADHRGPHSPPSVGFHGGPLHAWDHQIQNIHTVASHNFYSGSVGVAGQYAMKYANPVILELGSHQIPRNDLDSGVGMHICLEAGTPLVVLRAHKISDEFTEALKEQEEALNPSLIKLINEAFMERLNAHKDV